MRFLHALRRSPATAALILSNVGMFLVQMAWGGTTDLETHVRLGALMPSRIWEHGEVYRLLTGAWLHHGLFHLGLNMLALLGLGGWVERVYGPARTMMLYVVCALGAGLASATFMPSSVVLSVGASGAVLGMAGVLLGLMGWGKEPVKGWLRKLLGRALLRDVLLTFALGIGLYLFLPIIDNFGHAGGVLTGLALAGILRDPPHDHGPWVPWAARLSVAVVLLAETAMAAQGRVALDDLDDLVAASTEARVFGSPGSGMAIATVIREVDALHGRGEADEALALVSTYTAQVEDPERLGLLATWLMEARRDLEAEVALERWLDVAPNDPFALNGLAWHLVTRPDEALRDPDRAVTLAREALAALAAGHTSDLADEGWWVSVLDGVFEPLEPVLGPWTSEAERPDAMRAMVQDTLAEALWQTGETDEALALQRQAVAIGRALQLETLDEMEARLEGQEAAVGDAPPAEAEPAPDGAPAR